MNFVPEQTAAACSSVLSVKQQFGCFLKAKVLCSFEKKRLLGESFLMFYQELEHVPPHVAQHKYYLLS